MLTRPEPLTPLAVVGTDVANLGTLTPGQVVRTKFRVRNVSWHKPAHIRDMLQSCACTVADVSRKDLKPGDETTVELVFTAGKPQAPRKPRYF